MGKGVLVVGVPAIQSDSFKEVLEKAIKECKESNNVIVVDTLPNISPSQMNKFLAGARVLGGGVR